MPKVCSQRSRSARSSVRAQICWQALYGIQRRQESLKGVSLKSGMWPEFLTRSCDIADQGRVSRVAGASRVSIHAGRQCEEAARPEESACFRWGPLGRRAIRRRPSPWWTSGAPWPKWPSRPSPRTSGGFRATWPKWPSRHAPISSRSRVRWTLKAGRRPTCKHKLILSFCSVIEA